MLQSIPTKKSNRKLKEVNSPKYAAWATSALRPSGRGGEAVIRLHRELRTVGGGDEAPESFVGFSRTMRRKRSTKGGVLVPFAEPFVMFNGIFEVGIS